MTRLLPDEVVAAVGPIRQAGDGWSARCPAHDDTNPSLSLTVNPDGRVLVHCHAGCEQDQVLAALDLDPGVLNGQDRDGEWTPRGPAVAVYDYVDEDRRLLSQVLKTAGKDFLQRHPDPSKPHGWTWNLDGVRRVLFRLPELIKAREEGLSVCVAEGEKDVLALVHHGHVATCNLGGAGKWRAEYAAYFVDLDVTVFADKDDPGRAHARRVAATLDGVARRVWIVEAADPYKDIAEHLGAGRPLSDVLITHDPNASRPQLAQEFNAWLSGPEPEYDYVIPGLLARGERLMLTGFEGLGKTTMLRQIAVTCAAGLHPITFARMEPLRVLVVDCENGDIMSRKKYWPLKRRAAADGRPVPDDHLWWAPREEGLNLAADDDAEWLLERVVAYKPDLLIIGPTYRLHWGNPNDEETARHLTAAIDRARTRARCAVILEHHVPHGESGRIRNVRPVGSSLYMRWPEFGYGIVPSAGCQEQLRPEAVDLQPWRGDRDERKWPHSLHRGGEGNWPWVEKDPRGDPAPRGGWQPKVVGQ